MEVNKISNSPNFSGYKNILSGSIKKKLTGEPEFAFMSMQLDNIGHNDLEIWQDIQKKVFKKENPSDIISFACIFFTNFKKCFWVSGQDISIGNKGMEQYSADDIAKFKTFSFIANLTKRLMNENGTLVYNHDRELTANKARNDLTNLFKMKKYVYDRDAELLANNLVIGAYLAQEPPQSTAGVVNNKISAIMANHFKS